MEQQSKPFPTAAAVILAAGEAVRFGSDKLLADLDGSPVLLHSVLAFQRCEAVRALVVVTRPGQEERVRALCRQAQADKLAAVVAGGKTRALSSLYGVRAVPPETELIAVHDGSRPLVSQAVISAALATAARYEAALPALPVRDTIKEGEGGLVVRTPDRARLYAAQTPQCFRAPLLHSALERAAEQEPDITDDCLAVEHMGVPVHLCAGSERNIKITTPVDLLLARAMVRLGEEQPLP